MSPTLRRLPALLAVRPVAVRPRCCCRPAIYLRGWRPLHRRDPRRWHVGRLAAFLRRPGGDLSGAGVADRAVRRAAAAGSHAAAPAADDGRAAAPLAGLRRCFRCCAACREPIRTYWVAPAAALARCCATLFARLTHPLVAWPLFVGATWLWHTPRGYELALEPTRLALSSSTRASSARRCCSGIRSCGPIRAGRAGRGGCCSRTCFWPTCRTRCWPPG